MDVRSRSPSKRRAISDHGQGDVPSWLSLVAQSAANSEMARIQRANSDHGIYPQMVTGKAIVGNADRPETPVPIVTDHDREDIRDRILHLSEGRKMAIQQLGVAPRRQIDTASEAHSAITDLHVVLAEMREQRNCMRQDNVLLHNSMMEQERAMSAQSLETDRRDQMLFSPTHQALQQLSMQKEEMPSSPKRPDSEKVHLCYHHDSSKMSAQTKGVIDSEIRPQRKIPCDSAEGLHWGGRPAVSTNVPGSVPVTPYFPITAEEPPKYVSDKFELYHKEILRWKDIHNEVIDQQLTATVAIRSDGITKSILIQFTESTWEDRAGRPFPQHDQTA